MRALYIGRFQPFHNGHLEVIRDIAGRFDDIVIAIGSAELSHTLDNPFTAGERHLMIHRSLEEEGVHNYYLVPIRDINRYSTWVAHVETLVPPFDVLFTNNPLTRRLFKEKGYKVSNPPIYSRDIFSGKAIREAIISGGEWEGSVPAPVAATLSEIGGIERLRELAEPRRGEG